MAVGGDDFVCLSDDDGLKHIDKTSQIQTHSERHGDTEIRRFVVKRLLLLNRVFGVGKDQSGKVLGH